MKRSINEIQQEISKTLSSKLGNHPWFRKSKSLSSFLCIIFTDINKQKNQVFCSLY
jgi:hypothetical protein